VISAAKQDAFYGKAAFEIHTERNIDNRLLLAPGIIGPVYYLFKT